MKIGLIDVDGHGFPNLALMKLSAYHKSIGDQVEWFNGFFEYDKVYMSKVFTFSADFDICIRSQEVIKGGTGYNLTSYLPLEVEHQYPDYSIYGITDTAYGFLSRGCPRQCDFCNVSEQQGNQSHKVSNLSEFWNGQKNIVLLDPNITACKEYENLFHQLINSKAYIDFSQGIDIRTMTYSKIELIKQLNIKHIHFAFDNYSDHKIITEKLTMFKHETNWNRGKVSVYVLVNNGSTLDQDLERIYFIKSLGFNPFVQIFNKDTLPKKHILRKLQRYVNNKYIFWSNDCLTFDSYLKVCL